MVSAICAKLQSGQTTARAVDVIGGSTFGLSIWPGHPHYEEALCLLQTWRTIGSDLREKVRIYNEQHDVPAAEKTRIVAYVGQNSIAPPVPHSEDEESDHEPEAHN